MIEVNMDQPWWVYTIVSAACAIVYLLAKVVERKYMKKGDDLFFLYLVLLLVSIFSVGKMAVALGFFSSHPR